MNHEAVPTEVSSPHTAYPRPSSRTTSTATHVRPSTLNHGIVQPDWRHLRAKALQYEENLLAYTSQVKPWDLEGALLSRAEVAAVSGLTWHVGLWDTFALRLAILYDAPIDDQAALGECKATGPALPGTAYGVEWSFRVQLSRS